LAHVHPPQQRLRRPRAATGGLTVVVRFFATLRDVTGQAEIDWDAPVTDLGELLEALAGSYGPAFRRTVLAGERLAPAVMVLVNGHNARLAGGAQTPLKPHDEIAIFPPLAGG
jgi:molybdopterin synthase sulfur carrier subunit